MFLYHKQRSSPVKSCILWLEVVYVAGWFIFIMIEQFYCNQADQVQKVVDNGGKGNDAQYIGIKKK